MSQVNRRVLHQFVVQYFNDSELRNLCFDLAIDYESLPGNGKNDKAHSLIEYTQRYVRMDELIAELYALRPHVKWVDNDAWGAEPVQPLTSPKFAEYLFYLLLPKKDCDHVLGDLEEQYQDAYNQFGKWMAIIWCYKQIGASSWPLITHAAKKLLKEGVLGWIGDIINRIIP